MVSWIRTQGLVGLAGLALIAAGSLCLSLSAAVARTGSWWQGTLDAFGAGLVVGGLVDVLVTWWLNQRDKAEDHRKQQAFDGLARFLIGQPDSDAKPMAWDLLISASPYMDPKLRDQLFGLVRGGEADLQIPDHGEATQAPGNR